MYVLRYQVVMNTMKQCNTLKKSILDRSGKVLEGSHLFRELNKVM